MERDLPPVRITAAEFSMDRRCETLVRGCRCLGIKGHRGKHDPSKYKWKGAIVNGRGVGEP